jgi:hypothetical protein
MSRFHETLNKNTKVSALALRDLLGSIELWDRAGRVRGGKWKAD